jgi:transcriptional regulator with XRE-family HTH domain
MAAIGEVLRETRLRLGLSQGAVAKRAGMTAAQLSHIEMGRSASPEFITITRIAAALQLSLDNLAALSGIAGYTKQAAQPASADTRITEALSELGRIERASRQAADTAAALSKRLGNTLPKLGRTRRPRA